MDHTLSLKVFNSKIWIVKSSKRCSRCSKFGWCLTHVGRMFADEEMPLSFLPFFGAICCGLTTYAPFLTRNGDPLLFSTLGLTFRELGEENSIRVRILESKVKKLEFFYYRKNTKT